MGRLALTLTVHWMCFKYMVWICSAISQPWCFERRQVGIWCISKLYCPHVQNIKAITGFHEPLPIYTTGGMLDKSMLWRLYLGLWEKVPAFSRYFSKLSSQVLYGTGLSQKGMRNNLHVVVIAVRKGNCLIQGTEPAGCWLEVLRMFMSCD